MVWMVYILAMPSQRILSWADRKKKVTRAQRSFRHVVFAKIHYQKKRMASLLDGMIPAVNRSAHPEESLELISQE
jgi:hypothetical protein